MGYYFKIFKIPIVSHYIKIDDGIVQVEPSV